MKPEEIKLTPEQEAIIARAIKTKKPWILAVEDLAQQIQYGESDVHLKFRAGEIVEMFFYSKKTWLRDKAGTDLT